MPGHSVLIIVPRKLLHFIPSHGNPFVRSTNTSRCRSFGPTRCSRRSSSQNRMHYDFMALCIRCDYTKSHSEHCLTKYDYVQFGSWHFPSSSEGTANIWHWNLPALRRKTLRFILTEMSCCQVSHPQTTLKDAPLTSAALSLPHLTYLNLHQCNWCMWLWYSGLLLIKYLGLRVP